MYPFVASQLVQVIAAAGVAYEHPVVHPSGHFLQTALLSAVINIHPAKHSVAASQAVVPSAFLQRAYVVEVPSAAPLVLVAPFSTQTVLSELWVYPAIHLVSLHLHTPETFSNSLAVQLVGQEARQTAGVPAKKVLPSIQAVQAAAVESVPLVTVLHPATTSVAVLQVPASL